MPTRQQPSRGPGPTRRLLAAAGVAAAVLLNVWAIAAASGRSALTGQELSGGGVPRMVAIPSDSTATGSSTASPAPTVVQKGDGRFTVIAVPAGAPTASGPATPARTVRYTVEAEGGLGANTRELATTVAAVLLDARGWQTQDKVRFVNVSPAAAAKGAHVDVRVTLASPDTTDRLCAPLETAGQVSCHNHGRVLLNLRRWLLGADAYGTDLAAYRIYLVNHEVGHALGHGHVGCPGKGQDAPVMMQQTYGLDGCVAWPWPTARMA